SVVAARYRAVGQAEWREAMPLRRVPAGKSRPPATLHTWKNRHAGSIFDLQPDTEYEIHLRLTDPDGGSAERTLRARTRPVPRAASGAKVAKVTPQTFADTAAAVKPGEVLLLEPGEYGALTPGRDGAPGQPVVLRGTEGAICES